MKTDVFFNKLSSVQIQENIAKHFNAKVNLSKYSREQLEDMRNKLRTHVFQQEGQAGINDLLTNETYQKNKAMLELLNTRIKEMLGEDIKKLKDKLQMLEEGKKNVKTAKHPQGSKGSGDGNLANNYPPFDKVTRGDVIAGATGKDQKGGKAKKEESVEEGFDDMMKDVKDRGEAEKKAKGTGKFNVATTEKGKKYTRKPETFDDGGKDKDMKKAEKKVGESTKSCNHTAEGKMCPVHKMKECPMGEAKQAKEPFAVGMAAAKKEAGIKKTPAKDLPKAVVKKGHEIGKSIKKSQKNESAEIYRRHVKVVNESLQYLLSEDEEEKAEAITAAGDMANDFTSWMQRVGQYQTKVMIELGDEIRHNFGAQQAEAFKQAVAPALASTLETLTSQREIISRAIATLAGEQLPEPEPMGTTPDMAPTPEMEPGVEPAAPDAMNEPIPDEFAASEPATTGREMRESKFSQKLAESHSIMAKLAR